MDYNGIAASAGFAIGKTFIYSAEKIRVEDLRIFPEEVPDELEKFSKALDMTKKDLEILRNRTCHMCGEDKAAIFSAHLTMLKDPYLSKEVQQFIRNKQYCTAKAVEEAIAKFVKIFDNISDSYIKERTVDLQDVGDRLIRNVLGIKSRDLGDIQEEVVIVAHDLTPSDTASLNPKFILGFITDEGSTISHTAIIARTMGIPAVVGLGDITKKIASGDIVMVDGISGTVTLHPIDEEIAFVKEKKLQFAKEKLELQLLADYPAVTKDGVPVQLWGNIGSPDDLGAIVVNGGTGIGLYRTEFLYMDRKCFPDEEVQFQAYKEVVEKMAGKPVVIRTLDIGGDKNLPYLQIPKEENPFLGWRAIRISLDEKEMFKVQLRAILRASAFGEVLLMYPMVSCVEEVQEANKIVAEVKLELENKRIDFNRSIQVGVMIEIPSAALTADIIAKEVNFFSIGTNDLCQYSTAVDRMNAKVAPLYKMFHPALLRMFRFVIDEAHKNNRKVGMCGEMASNPFAAILLVGMGLDELSMSGNAILSVKRAIRSITMVEACDAAKYSLALSTAAEIEDYLKKRFQMNLEFTS